MKNTLITLTLVFLMINTTNAQEKTYLKEKHHEAISWLESNSSQYAFAGNRFNDTKAALDFVKNLYKHGAVKVYVMGIKEEAWWYRWFNSEGGPYADVLVIILPENNKQRKILFSIHGKEAISEGFDIEKDVGQKELLSWWD